jgi:hypothetical protein
VTSPAGPRVWLESTKKRPPAVSFFRDQADGAGGGLLGEKRSGIWVNADDLGFVPFIRGGQNAHRRGDSAADLNNLRRLLGTHETIQEIRLDLPESLLQPVHLAGPPMKQRGGQAGLHALGTCCGKRQLRLDICAGDSIHAKRTSPCGGAAQQRNRRDLRVEMTWQNIDLEPLPDFKDAAQHLH